MMSWLEALECYLAEFIRPLQGAKRKRVIGAIVWTAEEWSPTPTWCELVGGWWVTERKTTCGNIALHLFPSVE